MRISLLSVFSIIGLFSVSNAAQAQQSPHNEKVKEIDFEEQNIEGTVQKPDGSRINEEQRATFNPLTNLRENFSQEMCSSIDSI